MKKKHTDLFLLSNNKSAERTGESVPSRRISNNSHMKTYIFKFSSLDHRSEDGSQKLDYLIGEGFARLMLSSWNPLELLRFKLGNETIIARKRFNDCKVVIFGKGEYPIRKIRDMYENTTRNIQRT